MTIIGLGNTGCNIAEKFEKIPDVKVYLVDSNIDGDENCISIPEYKTPEEYENNFPNISEKFKNIDDEIYLIVGGSGKISGASLSLLKSLKNRELNVVYIRPDLSSLSDTGKMQDKLVFNVFQEYARSGIFKKCFIIDNLCAEKILGNIPVIGYFDNINNIIFNALGFYLTYKNKKAIIENLTPVKDVSRICTVGFYNLEEDEEELLYNLENINDKHFYFLYNEEKLKKDGSLLKNIKDSMAKKTSDDTKSSFCIFSTENDLNLCYVVAFSKRIQN